MIICLIFTNFTLFTPYIYGVSQYNFIIINMFLKQLIKNKINFRQFICSFRKKLDIKN